MTPTTQRERGSALVTVLMLVALLSALLGSYFVLTRAEMTTTRASMDRARGFFVAEAGLNLRAEAIRQQFLGFHRPEGTSPVITPGVVPCTSDAGADDFVCTSFPFDGRTAVTYVTEPPGNPTPIVIPPGETVYANLNALEYRYLVSSVAVSADDAVEAVLEMAFKSRLVPLFQFAVFYNKDLEITPGPPMTFSGPIHTNFDLYAAADTTVDVAGQVTVVGDIYRGRKEADICWTGPFTVEDVGGTPLELPVCDPAVGRKLITTAELGPWGGTVLDDVDPVTVPTPDAIDPNPGNDYWDLADLRLVYDVPTDTVSLRDGSGNVHVADGDLAGCAAGTIGTSTSFRNNRELDGGGNAKTIRMLEIDTTALLDCLEANPALIDGKPLDEDSEGGMVWYFGVTGPDQAGINDYGVRVRNAAEIASSVGTAPIGLSVISNQAMYIWGDYNAVNKVPAAFMCDSMNILSGAWDDADDTLSLFLPARDAIPTTIQAAFLAGTDTSGGNGGPEGVQDSGPYSGGVHNFLRLHEDWRNVTLTYRGSLVSLNQPQHVDGVLVVGSPEYRPPDRDYGFDTDFNDVANLPPLTPMFVYLKHEMFVRSYEY